MSETKRALEKAEEKRDRALKDQITGEKVYQYLMAFGKNVLFYYVIFVVAYCLICYIVYSIRYYKAKKSLKKYYNRLKQLSAMYDLEKRKG